MSLKQEDIKHIAKLARLSLSENELFAYTESLSQILNYVEQLNELDTTNVNNFLTSCNQDKALREDKIVSQDLQQAIAKNAPSMENDSFKVPQMK